MSEILRKVLRSKIHRATVTHANPDYEGSITLSPELMELAGIVEYEAVAVWDVTNASRFETYVITGNPGSSEIAVNGAAAHLVQPGDIIIVACFQYLTGKELTNYQPCLVFVDANNQALPARKEIPGPQLRLV